MVGMMKTPEVKARIGLLKTAGLTVAVDFGAGTVKAIDADGAVAFTALQKGKGQPWIVRHVNTKNCKWQ